MANINIRVDDNLKLQAQELFSSLGMDMSTAMNIFLHQAVAFRGIPFVIQQPQYNAETEQAIQNVRDGVNLSKAFDSVEELWEDLNAEDPI